MEMMDINILKKAKLIFDLVEYHLALQLFILRTKTIILSATVRVT